MKRMSLPSKNGVWSGGVIALAILGGVATAGAQTALGRGDVAFTGYNSGGTDELSFVVLTDVSAGTSLSFTERGWLAAGGFRAGEATFTLAFGSDYACGTEFRAVMSPLAVTDPSGASAGTLTGGGLALSTSGDQVFAFQGPEPTAADEGPFLTGIQMNGPWDADATSTNTSARPLSLGEGTAAISIAPEVDNARYDCSIVAGSGGALAAVVHDAARWSRSDTTPFDLSVRCGFSCGLGPTPSPTSTPTSSPLATPTPAVTSTPAPTAVPTPTPTQTATPVPTSVPTAVPTSTPVATTVPTATPPPAPTPTPGASGPQTRSQQRCIDTLNQGMAKVARAQGSEVARCIKAFAKGREASATTCIASDGKQKVAKMRAAVTRAAAKRCSEMPDFGPSDAGLVGAAGAASASGLAALIFGDLDAGLAREDIERALSKCQQGIAKLVRKCQEVRFAEFNRCKKAGLKDASITSSGQLVACLGADPKRKVARACDLAAESEVDAIRAGLVADCIEEGVDLRAALPPCADATDAESAHACIRGRVLCRACVALGAADALPVDCDAIDDGQENGSCTD
jgi:hypothetical protein